MSLLSCSSFDLYCILSHYYFAMIELIKMDGWIKELTKHLQKKNNLNMKNNFAIRSFANEINVQSCFIVFA